MSYLPILEVTRGSIVESVHHGAAAVVYPSGELKSWFGDPETVTYLRSAAKPIQALELIESGAADHFKLTPKEIAVICASHTGTDEHVSVVASILDKAGLVESDLQCGVHAPFDKATAKQITAQGEDPTPIRNNCSGKHAGMLALARYIGESIEGYYKPEHPVQHRLLNVMGEMSGLDTSDLILGVDGCSVPTYAMPIRSAATAFANLMAPRRFSRQRAEACERIVEAMTIHPRMVSGPRGFDTRLMEVGDGMILAKGGAEGFQGIGLIPGTIGEGSAALGVAIKIGDGNLGQRARSPISITLLSQLGALDATQVSELAYFNPHVLINHRGQTVGRIEPRLVLSRSEGEAVD